VRDETVSLLNVHRTLLELGGETVLDGAAPDARGRNLLDESEIDDADSEETDWLVEYHGLTDRHRTVLAGDGFDVRPLDRDLHALAAPGYYGWETPDGFREENDPSAVADTSAGGTPRERLDALLADRDRRVVANDVAVSEAVEAQLRDLGYA
jgi:hypothetical protein